MTKQANTSVYLSDDLKIEMKIQSAKMKISTSKFIRQAIRHYIKTSKL